MHVEHREGYALRASSFLKPIAHLCHQRWTQGARLGLLFIGLQVQTLPTSANIYVDNPNFLVDSLKYTQFSPIVELVSTHNVTKDGKTGISQGTGFLVSPCYVLTAAHVIFGDNKHFDYDGDYTMILLIGKITSGGFVTHVPVTPDMNLMSQRGSDDWAMLKLPDDKCFGVHPKIGWYEAAARSPRIGQSALAVGFNINHPNLLSASIGSVRGVGGDDLILYNGSFTGGASGGPVFIKVEGVSRVAGIITTARDEQRRSFHPTYVDVTANEFQSIDRILGNSAVKARLDADKARFGNKNSAEQRMSQPWPQRPKK